MTAMSFCQDIVGRRAYRLAVPRAAPDIWSPDDGVEVRVSSYFRSCRHAGPALGDYVSDIEQPVQHPLTKGRQLPGWLPLAAS